MARARGVKRAFKARVYVDLEREAQAAACQTLLAPQRLARAVADPLPFELAAVGVIAAVLIATMVRRRGFIFFASLGMFAVTGLEVMPGALPTCSGGFPDLAWHYEYIFQPLQWYRLVTHIFVHDACGAAHLVGNVFTLVLLGWPLEEKIGWKRTAAIFFLTGIVGAVFSSFFVYGVQATFWLDKPAFGASGSIFGVIAYFAVRYPKEQVYAPIFVIFMRVPVPVAAVAALGVQALILLSVSEPSLGSTPFFGSLKWPSVLAHLMSFGVGMIATRIPSLRASDDPRERAYHLDLEPLRQLVVKPADQMVVEDIIKEDIPEVAQAKLEALVARARCPKCQGVLTLKGRKLTSACGWAVEFRRRPAS